MPLIITCACLKGGAGKSTIASTIASVLHTSGHRTLVVDVDPQRTLGIWATKATEFHVNGPLVVSLESLALRRDLARVSADFDVVLIDCPPRLGKETRASIAEAHLVLVPLNPGPGDYWALAETAELVEEVRAIRPELIARAVLNRCVPGTAILKDMTEKVGELMPLLPVTLGNRVAYAEAMAVGEGAGTYASGKARDEAHAVTKAALAAIEAAA